MRWGYGLIHGTKHRKDNQSESLNIIHGNFAYLALICALWSSRGRSGKKVPLSHRVLMTSQCFYLPTVM